MSDLEKRITELASAFAKAVIDALRGMTLDELAGLSLLPGRTAAPTKRAARELPTATVPARPKSDGRKLQGRYMGLLKNFTGSVRGRIKAIAKSKGVAAGVAEMVKLLPATPRTKTKREATKAAPKPVAAAKPARRKLVMTPARKAALKVQGQYIGLMRSLPATQKAKYKALAKKSGMAAAVEAMRRGRP